MQFLDKESACQCMYSTCMSLQAIMASEILYYAVMVSPHACQAQSSLAVQMCGSAAACADVLEHNEHIMSISVNNSKAYSKAFI